MNINLTLQELQYVVNVLVQRPYAEVADLIAKIKAQHEAQLPKPIPQEAEAERPLPFRTIPS